MSPVPLLATCGMDGDAMTKSETALVYTAIGTTWKETAMARLGIMQDQRDEIRSLQDRISAMTSAPLRDSQSVTDFIDQHSVTCDCCDHVMIDVTAARAGGEQHCVAGDPEGDGMGCAHSWRETVVTLEAEGDQLRAKVEELEAERNRLTDLVAWVIRLRCELLDGHHPKHSFQHLRMKTT